MSKRETPLRLVLTLLLGMAGSQALAGFAGTDVFLPMVGRQAGIFPSNWYTTVWIYNPGPSAVTARVYLLVRNTANPSPPWVDVSIAAGDTEKIENAVESLFHQQVFGAMRVTCTTQKLIVTSRVYSKGAGSGEKDSAGQDFAGVPASFAIGAGEKSQILGVYQTQPAADSDYRFNFGFVETTGRQANVRVHAIDESGLELDAKDFNVREYSQRQVAFKDHFPSVSTENVRLEVEVLSGTGKVIAYGSGIANGSQDPTTFEMSYQDSLLGIATVQHDATLVGDGTAGAPLGLADAAVTDSKVAAGIAYSKLAGAPMALPPDGPAGGSLAGTYPNPGIANLAVGTGQLADLAVAAQKIAARAVTGEKLADPFVATTSGVRLTSSSSDQESATLTAEAPTGSAIRAWSATKTGVFGGSGSSIMWAYGTGVLGKSELVSGHGVWGIGSNGAEGVSGDSDSFYGVHGTSTSGVGVYGSTSSGWAGVIGVLGTPAGSGGPVTTTAGVLGSSRDGIAVGALSNYGTAIFANSGTGRGVDAHSAYDDGVRGSTIFGYGVHGTRDSFEGFLGYSDGGVLGRDNTSGNYGYLGRADRGVFGHADAGAVGVYGEGGGGEGVYGRSVAAAGVRGESASKAGVWGHSTSDVGIYGTSTNSYAGYFNGDVHVTGDLSAGGTKPFRIDHPLDPENRELWHAAIESNEVLNVYSGNAVTDAGGTAVVELPAWFEALNTDFRYQLTVIGRFAQAIVEREIEHNRFTIRTNLANVKVSWQVTAKRNDAWMRAHPFAVERDKPAGERGSYLAPLEHGQPEERGVDWVLHAAEMKQVKEIREKAGAGGR